MSRPNLGCVFNQPEPFFIGCKVAHQNTTFPIVLFLLIAGSRPNAIRGIWTICMTNKYNLDSDPMSEFALLALVTPGKTTAPNLLCDNSHNQFMCKGAQQESRERCCSFTEPERGDGGCIDVSQEEHVDGLVPFTGVFVPCCCIPPGIG